MINILLHYPIIGNQLILSFKMNINLDKIKIQIIINLIINYY